MTYAALTAELDALLHELEFTPDLPLDELTQKVQRAYALIGEGRAHLRAAEEAVTRVIDAFGEEEEDEEDDDPITTTAALDEQDDE
ncbi:MAG: exodeoxyribonuclease VII small subunit [Hymenobacteraceae bacterium]|nr:exodeoxyribonuclease VII small subunit [Hymenobacteraceae bacterium]